MSCCMHKVVLQSCAVFCSIRRNSTHCMKRNNQKNAFQWDAYRPLQLPSGGGVSAQGMGVCLGGFLPRGCLPRGVYTSPLWTEFLTHACENITFPQLLLRTVININHAVNSISYGGIAIRVLVNLYKSVGVVM